jgi:multidrug efflux pump subunit AcrA (membrane-fusion protein)
MKLWLQPRLLALTAVLAVSCSKSEKPGAAPAASSPARSVKTIVAAPCKMDRAVSVTGSLAALDRSTLTIKVPGRLRQLSVALGSQVAAGETLAQVEPRGCELRVAQAEAALAQARAALGLPIEGTNDVARIDDHR